MCVAPEMPVRQSSRLVSLVMHRGGLPPDGYLSIKHCGWSFVEGYARRNEQCSVVAPAGCRKLGFKIRPHPQRFGNPRPVPRWRFSHMLSNAGWPVSTKSRIRTSVLVACSRCRRPAYCCKVPFHDTVIANTRSCGALAGFAALYRIGPHCMKMIGC